MHVGAEGKGAVLHVKRKTEDLKVAGGDEPQHPVPADVTRVVNVDVRTCLGDVIVHAEEGWKWKNHKDKVHIDIDLLISVFKMEPISLFP